MSAARKSKLELKDEIKQLQQQVAELKQTQQAEAEASSIQATSASSSVTIVRRLPRIAVTLTIC